jgi:hypothetical protein
VVRYTPPMRAAVHTRYGPPEVVLVSEVERQVPRDNRVLVKIHATTVNRTDYACRAARPIFVRFFTGLIRPRARRTGVSRQHHVNGRRQGPLSRTCFPIFELARQLLRRREPNCLQPQRRGR